MFQLGSVQVLFKEKSMLESIIAAKAKIVIRVNRSATYTSLQKQVNGKYVGWNESSIPSIEVSPEQCMSQIEIQFQFFKKDVKIGRARTFIKFGKNRSDCLDIVNDDFRVVGKFTFNIKWIKIPKVVFQKQHLSVKPSAKQHFKKQQLQGFRKPNTVQKLKKKQKKSFLNFLCCNSARTKLLVNKPTSLAITPIEYFDDECEYGPQNNKMIIPIQYYSQRIFRNSNS